MNRCIRTIDQTSGKHRIDAVLRYAIEIAEKLLTCIGGITMRR